MKMILDVLLLIIGFAALIKGADLFVDGSASVAKRLKVPGVIIGLTIVAMGTSAPELAVSTSAAIAGSNEIAVSNVVGSNIFNLLAVLGVCAMMKPLPVASDIKKRDYPISLVATVIILVLGANFVFSGENTNFQDLTAPAGVLYQWNGILILALFILYIMYTIHVAKKNRVQEEENTECLTPIKCAIYIIVGLAVIVAGGQIVVKSATSVAAALGMTETLIGLTIVAIGTSLPELVTSVVASRKGENGMAIGNVVGSNIFNLLFILGVSSSIHKISIEMSSFFDLVLLLAVSLIAYGFVLSGKRINRIEGGIMVLLYVAYTAYAIWR